MTNFRKVLQGQLDKIEVLLIVLLIMLKNIHTLAVNIASLPID
jgi:hypothetical protein